MSRISALKIDANFECTICNKQTTLSVSEAIYHGAPICQDCDEEMELLDCEIDTLE